ncbi:MAG: hypothetical protein GEU90_16200 [Gemmatimonas sp.]|nr:hypothetical protein [Gemmatimonas sp.]
MIESIGRVVGHAVLNRSTMAGLGAAALAAPVGVKMRKRHVSCHAASREAAAGLGAAALAAPIGIGAVAIGRKLRKRHAPRRRFNRAAMIGGLGAAAIAAGMGGKALSRRKANGAHKIHVKDVPDVGASETYDLNRSRC